jgi:hypothetical protein
MTNATATARRPVELWLALGTIALASAVYLPRGLVGHVLGITGFLLMVFAETAYTWRKKVTREGYGPLRHWMQAHVFAGLVGPYLVLLHTAFQFRGLAGVLSLMVLVVVASGLAGRFVYTAVPKVPAAPGARRVLAAWWLLHVPLAAAMFVLAAMHVAGALYYATFLR